MINCSSHLLFSIFELISPTSSLFVCSVTGSRRRNCRHPPPPTPARVFVFITRRMIQKLLLCSIAGSRRILHAHVRRFPLRANLAQGEKKLVHLYDGRQSTHTPRILFPLLVVDHVESTLSWALQQQGWNKAAAWGGSPPFSIPGYHHSLARATLLIHNNGYSTYRILHLINSRISFHSC